MKKACENDKLVIPEKYKSMSVSELKREEKKVLADILKQERPKKTAKTNKRKIVFNY